MMNLFIGMCKGTAGLPDHFKALGYSDKWIEYGFPTSSGDRVVPELIIASNKIGHTVLLECKSGANLDENQLQRYATVTSGDLRERAFLDPAECGEHDVVVVARDEFTDRILIGLDKAECAFPVLVETSDGLQKVSNRFSLDPLNSLFDPILSIDWRYLPTFFFPLDAESSLREYAELTIPAVLQLAAQGESRILVTDVAKAVVSSWNIIAPAYQKRMLSSFTRVIEHSANYQFRNLLRRNQPAESTTHCATWDVLNGSALSSGDRRTQVWKDMQQRQRDLIAYFSDESEQFELPLQVD